VWATVRPPLRSAATPGPHPPPSPSCRARPGLARPGHRAWQRLRYSLVLGGRWPWPSYPGRLPRQGRPWARAGGGRTPSRGSPSSSTERGRAVARGTLAWLCAEGRPAIPGSLPAFVPIVLACAAVVGVVAGLLSVRGRDGVAFAATGLAILTAAGAVFSRLYPAVLASSTQASHSLTAGAAAARHRSELVGLTMPGAGRGASLGLSGS
jgi:hypothetical protein